MSFEANRGQTDPAVRFLSRGPGYALFITPTEAVFSLRKAGDHADGKSGVGHGAHALNSVSAVAGALELVMGWKNNYGITEGKYHVK